MDDLGLEDDDESLFSADVDADVDADADEDENFDTNHENQHDEDDEDIEEIPSEDLEELEDGDGQALPDKANNSRGKKSTSTITVDTVEADYGLKVRSDAGVKTVTPSSKKNIEFHHVLLLPPKK